MRDYAQVCPQFWLGKTGKKLRGDAEAQLVALYLITSPHANMIGVFHCPMMYIAHETGMSLEGASKGLRRVVEEGFCSFDEEHEIVWVHEMAKFQIGDQLSPKDNRVKSTEREFQKIPECEIRQGFYQKYKDAFHLLYDEVPLKGVQSPFEAPSKPRAGTGAGTEQEKATEHPSPVVEGLFPDSSKKKAATTLRAFIDSCRTSREKPIPENDPVFTYAESVGIAREMIAVAWGEFKRYWLDGEGKAKRRTDWRETFRNAIRQNRAGLWFLREGEQAKWTTAGEQARRAAA
jgi:hypothetical protein